MLHISHRRIHQKLRKHMPEAVERAEKLFAFKYPKLFLLFGIIILAYFLFSASFMSNWINSFMHLGQFGVFLSGAMTSFGFTAPFGFGLLGKMRLENILWGTLIGGIGATIADLLIFKTIKLSFADEFKRLKKTKAIKEIEGIVKKNKHVLIRHYLLFIFAGIIIASPLPDEIGVSMLAGITTVKALNLAVIGFFLHSAAIFLILLI
jgi:hypothetical protein